MTRQEFYDSIAIRDGLGEAKSQLAERDKIFGFQQEDIEQLLSGSNFTSRGFMNPFCDRMFIVAPKENLPEVVKFVEDLVKKMYPL